jgi:hypothetical protein
MLELAVLIGSLVAWALGVMAAFFLWGAGWGSLGAIGLTALFWKQLLMVGVLGIMVFLAAQTQM